MRYGLPQYDLASLVEDPYVYLSEDVKDELKKYYFDKYYDIAGKKILNYDDFLTVYRQCAIQRLMQALGAYGFLGLVKEKKEFLKYIPNALCRIRSILDQSSGLNGLKRLLDVIPEAV
jgi:aminoglycoside/choline kinase family phosphotransferase